MFSEVCEAPEALFPFLTECSSSGAGGYLILTGFAVNPAGELEHGPTAEEDGTFSRQRIYNDESIVTGTGGYR